MTKILLGSIILTRQAMTVPHDQWTPTILIPGNVVNSVSNSTTQITWLIGDDDNQEERGVLVILTFIHMQMIMITKIVESPVGGGGRYCRNFWGGCAAGTPEPLTYTRASSAKFCYPILE